MKEHLQGECSPEGPGPGGAREKAGAKQGLEAVDPIQRLIADRGRPDIEGARTRSTGRETSDGARIGDDDVDAPGTVVVIISAARDLRIIDLGIGSVQILHDLEIEVGIIGWAPEADFRAKGAIGLNGNLGELLPAKGGVGDELAPERK